MTCQREASDQCCFTAGSVLLSSPYIMHCSVHRCSSKQMLFPKQTLQVTLFRTHCSVQANCNCPVPVPFGFDLCLAVRLRGDKPTGCSVVLHRPDCRDKVLLQPQFREDFYRTASAVAEPAAYTRQSMAQGVCREDR